MQDAIDLIQGFGSQVWLFVKSYFVFWVFFTFLEYVQPARSQPFWSRHQLTELSNGLFVAVFLWPLDSALKIYVVEGSFGALGIGGLIDLAHWPMVFQVLAGLFLMDIIQYTRHRLLHSRALWKFHAAHHSAVELRSSTHLRVHPIDFLINQIFLLSALYLVGFHAEALRWVLAAVVINNMWLHTNVDFRYVFPLNYLLVSPNYHKWHHTADGSVQNRNYADLFPLLDMLGGTYYDPKREMPDKFGVTGVSGEAPLHRTFWGTLVYPFIKKSE